MWGVCLTLQFQVVSFCFIFPIQSLLMSARGISTKLKVNIYQPDLLQMRQLKPDIELIWWRPVTKNSCQPLFFDRNLNLCSGQVSSSIHFPPLLTALAGASSALLLCPMLCCPPAAPGALLGLVSDALISGSVPCLHGNGITENSFRVEIVSSALSGFLNYCFKEMSVAVFLGRKTLHRRWLQWQPCPQVLFGMGNNRNSPSMSASLDGFLSSMGNSACCGQDTRKIYCICLMEKAKV